jgi:hypothetical protein
MDDFIKSPSFYIIFLAACISSFSLGGLGIIAGMMVLALVAFIFWVDKPYRKWKWKRKQC